MILRVSGAPAWIIAAGVFAIVAGIALAVWLLWPASAPLTIVSWPIQGETVYELGDQLADYLVERDAFEPDETCIESAEPGLPDAIMPHGLSVDSELPQLLVEHLDIYGAPIEDYELRVFREKRIVFVTRTFRLAEPDSEIRVFGGLVEVVLVGSDRGESAQWLTSYSMAIVSC